MDFPSRTELDMLYELLSNVVMKRKTCPSKLMERERERVSSELQKLQQIKVELEDSGELKQVELLHTEVSKEVREVPPALDLALVAGQLNSKKDNLAQVQAYLDLKAEWDSNTASL